VRRLIVSLWTLTLLSPAPAAFAEEAKADIAVSLARAAASENRHDDAIAGFRYAITEAPDRREEWLVELADQLSWSGDQQGAVSAYREAAQSQDGKRAYWARLGLARALSWNGDFEESIEVYDALIAEDPGNKDVRLARAEVLSWSGDLKSAGAAYRSVIVDHPDDPAAQVGLARTLNWDGRHREAIAVITPVLRDHPKDSQAALVRSEALLWMGRPDQSAQSLAQILGEDRENERAEQLLAQVKRAARPMVRSDLRRFNQSDDLKISEQAIEARVPFANGRGYVGGRYVGAQYEPPAATSSEITVNRTGLLAGIRFNDALGWNGSVFNDAIEVEASGQARDILTYDTYVTYTPNDLVRFDLGTSRKSFDSEATLTSALVAESYSASVDIVPNSVSRYSVRLRQADYSDANNETWWQLEAGRRFLKAPYLAANLRVTGFEFSLPGQPGYYNPDEYRSVELPVRLGWKVNEQLYVDLNLSGGRETEGAGVSRTIGSGGAVVSWHLNKLTELQFAYDYSTSSAFAASGFDRAIARVSLLRRF